MTCYNVRVGGVQSGARKKKVVEALIRDKEQLFFCRNFCHGLKHTGLEVSGRRKPIPANPNWTTATVPASFQPNAFQADAFPTSPHWVFIGEAGPRDMFTLADECVSAWRRYLAL